MKLVDHINAAIEVEYEKAGVVCFGINPGLAALKAIREPTYAMAEAGANESGEYGFGPHSATEVFTAMIDHAIKEAEQQ